MKSGLDSRRLSYFSALVAEGLGFATVVRGTSVSPCISSVPPRVWTPSEALVCDVLCGFVSLVLLSTFLGSSACASPVAACGWSWTYVVGLAERSASSPPLLL